MENSSSNLTNQGSKFSSLESNQNLQFKKSIIEKGNKADEQLRTIPYEPIPDLPIHLSQTIGNIVNRIDDWNEKAYENYKEDADTFSPRKSGSKTAKGGN